ncbi:MAG: beta-ketoacyl-ACP synthase II [Gammaproteobacteria bacterium]|nr:beta-ketoacyl-ACP synthase II [Gammaproteobacteria bacterium]
MTKRRVVVTGLGMVCPVGLSVSETWKNIIAGQSGIATIPEFSPEDYPVTFAGRVKDFDPTVYMPIKDVKKMDICIQYGFAAGVQAFEDAGLVVTEDNADRIGIAIGSGIGGLTNIEDTMETLLMEGPRRVSPFFIPSALANMAAGNLAIKYGMRGPNIAIVTACTTGTHNIGVAMRMIQCGDADVMVAGGAEKASCRLGMAGFAAARALSKRNDDPTKASRPWDKNRDGFVLGDGAGVIVLEEYDHAVKRGAKIYAELVGFGMSADAYHMTMPNGVGAYRAMENAVKDAHLHPADIDYINAHGTSTPAGDGVESQAVERLLGEAAQNVAMSSTKSMIGHLLGASGAVEAIFSILAIRDQIAPPTINLDEPDEGCNLNYVPKVAQKRKINVALSNSFGFGGTNGSIIFRKI